MIPPSTLVRAAKARTEQARDPRLQQVLEARQAPPHFLARPKSFLAISGSKEPIIEPNWRAHVNTGVGDQWFTAGLYATVGDGISPSRTAKRQGYWDRWTPARHFLYPNGEYSILEEKEELDKIEHIIRAANIEKQLAPPDTVLSYLTYGLADLEQLRQAKIVPLNSLQRGPNLLRINAPFEEFTDFDELLEPGNAARERFISDMRKALMYSTRPKAKTLRFDDLMNQNALLPLSRHQIYRAGKISKDEPRAASVVSERNLASGSPGVRYLTGFDRWRSPEKLERAKAAIGSAFAPVGNVGPDDLYDALQRQSENSLAKVLSPIYEQKLDQLQQNRLPAIPVSRRELMQAIAKARQGGTYNVVIHDDSIVEPLAYRSPKSAALPLDPALVERINVGIEEVKRGIAKLRARLGLPD